MVTEIVFTKSTMQVSQKGKITQNQMRIQVWCGGERGEGEAERVGEREREREWKRETEREKEEEKKKREGKEPAGPSDGLRLAAMVVGGRCPRARRRRRETGASPLFCKFF